MCVLVSVCGVSGSRETTAHSDFNHNHHLIRIFGHLYGHKTHSKESFSLHKDDKNSQVTDKSIWNKSIHVQM